MEEFALYAQSLDSLPEELMRRLGGVAHDNGSSFAFDWPDLSVVFHVMPSEEMAEHLIGFQGYVTHLCDGDPEERGCQILERIGRTRLVVRAVVEPGRDEEGRADALLGGPERVREIAARIQGLAV